MTQSAPRHTTYAALEEASLEKQEYLRGEVLAMAGGTPEHAALAGLATDAVYRDPMGFL